MTMTTDEILQHEAILRRMYVENKVALNKAREPITELRRQLAEAMERGKATKRIRNQLDTAISHYTMVRRYSLRRIMEYRSKHNYG